VNLNRVVLTGNLTDDPELRTTPGGHSVCTAAIAVNSREPAGGGEWRDRVDYFDVVVWGKPAENLVQYKAKGDPLAIDGRLRLDRWEKDGQKRSKVVIVADNVQWLPSKDRGQEPAPAREYNPPTSSEARAPYTGEQPSGGKYAGEPDDDIPF
jgi:single-strand DNA-binding protein